MKNVILLTIDTLRRDVLGCYGSRLGVTPFIDSVADAGLKFTKAQAVAPYTQASFPGILTSSFYLDYADEESLLERLSPRRVLISQVLKRAGVTTAAFHSNPYLGDYFGWNRGWDQFYDSMEQDASPMSPFVKGDVINRLVDDWLSSSFSRGDGASLFLWCHYMDVHEPYIPEQEYINLIDSSVDLTKEEMFQLSEDVVLKRDVSDKETVNLLWKLYLSVVRQTDDHVRGFFQILEKHGLLDDSVVIVTTDHGEEFDDHGSLSHNGKMYAELIDTPMIIHNYRRGEVRVCDTLVSGLDIAPTIAYLFGLEPVKAFQGSSLLPLDRYPRGACYGEAIGKLAHRVQPTDEPVYYCRKNDIKIIYRAEEDSWKMFDLDSDPGEVNNVVHDSPLTQEMKDELRPRIEREAGPIWKERENTNV